MMSPLHALSLRARRLRFSAVVLLAAALPLMFDGLMSVLVSGRNAATAQTDQQARSLTLRADIQEANAKTGVVTARGNVQILYPARQIQATSAQAQYFSRERRIVLTGNVYVLQQGNSLRGENVTYLIDEGRFVALPIAPRQVESIYLVQDANLPTPTPNANTPITQPEFPSVSPSPVLSPILAPTEQPAPANQL
jgi:lipopolysaccharide export system protein LptA